VVTLFAHPNDDRVSPAARAMVRAVPLRRRLPLLLVALSLACASSSTPEPVTPGPAPSGTAPSTSGPEGPSQPPAADPLAGWEKIRDEDGIVVHRKEVEGSPLLAFRGDGIIQAPIARVALIQMDLLHSPEWMESLVEARVLENRSETSFLTYSHIGAPPMISDRDFVNEVNIDFDPPKRIRFNIHSVESPAGPATKFVRGKLLHSTFELTALDENRTRIVCEIHADPMGSLPKFAVNVFQKGWAFKTITQLRVQAKRADVVERAPQIRALLGRRGFPL
jgi:hypothetical protein